MFFLCLHLSGLSALSCNHWEWKINQISWEARSSQCTAGPRLVTLPASPQEHVIEDDCWASHPLLSENFHLTFLFPLELEISFSAEEIKLNLWLARGSRSHLTVLFLFWIQCRENHRRILVSREPCLRRSDVWHFIGILCSGRQCSGYNSVSCYLANIKY